MNKSAQAFIALGSNLDEPLEQVNRAVTSIQQLKDVSLTETSPWYRSAAVGPGKQPDYINGVISIVTTLAPLALLSELQAIENAQGRQREVRWGARTLDLDLLLYNQDIIDTETLQVPHPEMANRNFVLQPLFDLAPALVLPDGRAIADLLKECGTAGLHRLTD